MNTNQASNYQATTAVTACIFKKANRELAEALANDPEKIARLLDLFYLSNGLTSEAGEVAGKIKKQIRDHKGDMDDPEFKKAISKELGDVCFYISELCSFFNLPMQQVLAENAEKILARLKNGTISGNGDNR